MQKLEEKASKKSRNNWTARLARCRLCSGGQKRDATSLIKWGIVPSDAIKEGQGTLLLAIPWHIPTAGDYYPFWRDPTTNATLHKVLKGRPHKGIQISITLKTLSFHSFLPFQENPPLERDLVVVLLSSYGLVLVVRDHSISPLIFHFHFPFIVLLEVHKRVHFQGFDVVSIGFWGFNGVWMI